MRGRKESGTAATPSSPGIDRPALSRPKARRRPNARLPLRGPPEPFRERSLHRLPAHRNTTSRTPETEVRVIDLAPAGRRAGRGAQLRAPTRSRPAAPSSARGAGFVRSAPNAAWRLGRASRRWRGGDAPLATRADRCEDGDQRDEPCTLLRRRGLGGGGTARMPPVTTRPAQGFGLAQAGSDRRQKRPSGQWQQGS